MSRLLAKLRADLDVTASPLAERPGLLLRDPFRYSEQVVVMPPILCNCLALFDGQHNALDLQEHLTRVTGRIDVGDAAQSLADGLSTAGFLEDEIFRAMRTEREDEFARATVREAAFSGGGYPSDAPTLTETITGWMDGQGPAAQPPPDGDAGIAARTMAIAAPHVSPHGGVATYRAAYRALDPRRRDQTFVILGTSHYGRPNRFGLCRKSFATPLGQAQVAADLCDHLARHGGDAVDLDDYCHAVEHSIEFQVLFLQTLFGPSVRILPILCGPLLCRAARGARPEDDAGVGRFLDALGELSSRHDGPLSWVLGVDLAHVGRRYGDAHDARRLQGALQDVAARDQARLARVTAADADGFWELTHDRGADDLKWCGLAPLYSFLRACPSARGKVLDYDQWNIDESSVVSFAALAFTEPS